MIMRQLGHERRHKKLRFMIALAQTKSSNDELKTDSDRHRVRDQLMSFQEWFGVAIEDLPASLRNLQPRRQIMVHTPPPCKTMSKSFAATVHMSEDFPLTVSVYASPCYDFLESWFTQWLLPLIGGTISSCHQGSLEDYERL